MIIFLKQNMKTLGIIIGLLIFGGMFSSGAWDAWKQHHKIGRICLPADAVVLEAHNKHIGSGGGNSNIPAIKYRYTVGDKTYTSNQFEAMVIGRSLDRTGRIVTRYRVGDTVRAYYDPDNPDEALLSRKYAFHPYIFVLGSIPFLSLCLTVGLGTLIFGRRQEYQIPLADGSYEIARKENMRQVFWGGVLIASLWHGMGFLAWGHYFRVAVQPYSTLGIVITIGYEVLGLIPIGVAIKYWLVTRNVSEARVFADTMQSERGSEIAVRVEQTCRSRLRIEEFSGGLTCRKEEQVQRGRYLSGEDT